VEIGFKFKFFDFMFSSKSKLLSRLAIYIAMITLGSRWILPSSLFILVRRFLVSLILPNQSSVALIRQFEAIIPCSPKDNEVIEFCVQGVLENATGCESISIVTTTLNVPVLKAIFLNVSKVKVLDESKILPSPLFQFIEANVPNVIRGWSIQQALKLHMAQTSTFEAVLAVDADTVLLRPRIFFYDEYQQLLIATHEYHSPYREHIARVWPQIQNFFTLSFVPHHQLMQKSIIVKMFGAGHEGILRWFSLGDPSEGSPYSEYESYGQYVMNNGYTSKVSIAKWGNASLSRSYLKGISIQNSQVSLRHLLPNHYSVSLHSYIP
jgi:hypothetical protein